MGLVVASYVQATFTAIFDPARVPGAADASACTIVAKLQAAYPLYQLSGIDYPTARRGTYLSYLVKGNQLGPLHVGSFAGLGVKILWSALALSFPVLAISGTIMWWRRVVRASVTRSLD